MKTVTWEELMACKVTGFQRGEEFWSNDGETWHRGRPPKREPLAAGIRVTFVDYERGEIAVETTD